jgi:hypothetical protein
MIDFMSWMFTLGKGSKPTISLRRDSVQFTKFSLDILTTMFDNEEVWFVWKDGSAEIVNNASLMDC